MLQESQLKCLYEISGLEPSVQMFHRLEERCDGTMFTQPVNQVCNDVTLNPTPPSDAAVTRTVEENQHGACGGFYSELPCGCLAVEVTVFAPSGRQERI